MKWYNQAVFYHIYPLGLCNAPRFNDNGSIVNRFLDLEKWIPHIYDLGCNAIYIGPLFESVGHGYETTDYKLVDRRLGDNNSFKQFVEKCHDAGIKVVVDGVFNHTGREFFAFKDVRMNRENSRYKDWYCGLNFHSNNEYNDGFSYEAWRGHNVLVKLNQHNPEVKNYIFDVIRFWVSEFNIDGIRLDCADVLDFGFMREMRVVANSVKEDFWLMGEVIHGDYGRWVNEETLHSVTNYELHKGLYSGHNDHNYFEIAHTINRLFGDNSPVCKGRFLYSFVDNHDVDRIYDKLNNKDHLIPVYVLLYTLPGIPSIYYGSEFAIPGKKANGQDEPLRPAIDLTDYREDKVLNSDSTIEERLNIYKDKKGNNKLLKLIMLLAEAKKNYMELSYGKYMQLSLTNRQYVFARVMDNGAVIVAVNNDDADAQVNVNIPIDSNMGIDILTKEEIIINNRNINIKIKANDAVVIKLK